MSDNNTITRLRDLKISAQDKLMLDPRIIVIEQGHNPRDYSLKENRDHLDQIKASVRARLECGQVGLILPMIVRFDQQTKSAVLVDGECRLRANLELINEGVEIVSVPVIQSSPKNPEQRLLEALIANTGKPLSKWESGAAFRRLAALGNTEEMIASKTGFSSRFIKEAMELADAPEEVKMLLSEQAVTPALALQELRQHGEQAGAILQGKVAESRERAKASGKGPKSKGGKPSKNKPLKKAINRAKTYKLDEKTFKAVLDIIEDVSLQNNKEGAAAEKVYLKLKDLKPA